MRYVLRLVIIVALMLGGWATPVPWVSAANLDGTADRVFGQLNFTSSLANSGGISASSLNTPFRVALDAQGNMYVADSYNHRVLEYDTPLTTDTIADRVFGQPGFTSNTQNNGGLSAQSLFYPYGVVVDILGNLYVADNNNHRVLEYDTPLTTDTIADRVLGQPDFISNTPNNGGINANSLWDPFSLALDAQGNLYVADYGNNRVLEYNHPLTDDTTADRVFGQPGFTSGTANNNGISANSLYLPTGVSLSAQGDLYVADYFNHRVLEYNAPLTTGTTADLVFGQPNFTSNTPNNNGISASSLNLPVDVSVDAQGNLYVVEAGNNRVLEFNTPLTDGIIADRVFGQLNFTSGSVNGGGASAGAGTLNNPFGVLLDAQGNLYVADIGNNRVLEFDVPVPYGTPTLSALSPSTVAAGSPAFALTVHGSGFVAGSTVRWNGSNRPTIFVTSLLLTASLSSADVAGGGPFAVTVFTPAPGGGTSTLINLPLYHRNGQDTVADGVLGQPNFTANNSNNPLLPGGANQLFGPFSVSVDRHSARLFVADTSNHRVLSWPNALAFANGQAADLVIGQPDFYFTIRNNGGVSATSLANPLSVAVDAQGNLYVADNGNHRVLEYTAPLSNGMAANRVFGQGSSFTTALPNNGGISANSLNSPYAVALDTLGNLYVADAANNRVLEYNTPLTAGTTADRVFGQLNFTSNTVLSLSASSLNSPANVALDPQGNLYVADTANNRVLEYNLPLSAGTVADHVFGQPNFTSNAANNGGLNANGLNSPNGVALDARGNLYLVDVFNHRVLEYDTPLTVDAAADRVFGQPNFISNTANNGGVSASSLSLPIGVALDIHGYLFVTDSFNHRVLVYDPDRLKIFLPLIKR